jgi:CHAD domain-containing protein
MTVWIEVAMQAEGSSDDAFSALANVAVFKDVEPHHARLMTRDIAVRAPGWRLSVETHDGAYTLDATQQTGAPMPGFSRYRLLARPAGENLAQSLREFAEAEDGRLPPFSPDDPMSKERGIERVTWRIGDIVATFESSADRRATLRLVAPAMSEPFDALFRVASDVVETAPFGIAPREAQASDNEAVHASRLDLPRDATRREAFALIAASIAEQWFGNAAAARAGLGDEHVHQLRVAQRRLKTLLKLFRDDIDESWSERVAPGLKWFGDLLADARDWDVFTDKTLPAYAQSDDTPERWQTLIAAADVQRNIARDKVRDALASAQHARLTLAFIEWLARFESHEDESPMRFVSFARERVRKDYRRIARVPDLTTLDPHARHRVRIHAKRLRYTLDFFRSVTTRRTRKQSAKLLSELQTVLGEANDAAVAADRLASIPEASDYQRGFARAWGAASAKKDAQEGEKLLRSMRRPRLKASI